MFYSYDLLCRHKDGRFSTIWLAATKNTKKLNKCLYMKVNIPTVCSEIANIVEIRSEVQRGEERQRFSLYLSSMLMHGACLVYKQQVIYFMQQLTLTWESLHSTATRLEKISKARHERTDDESDDDSDGPTKKKTKKRVTKKKNVPTDSLEALENNLEQVLAENANELENLIVQPNAEDNFQLIEPNVPMELDEIPLGIFGTFDNALLDRMIEGRSIFPENDDPALIEELNGSVLIQAATIADETALNEQQNVNDNQQVVDGDRQIIDDISQVVDGISQVVDGIQEVVEGNRQEKSLAPLEQEPMDVVVEEAAVQLAEPIVLTPVDARQIEREELQVPSTVDQVIEDVIGNGLRDQGLNEDELNGEPPRKRLRNWKKGNVADEKNYIEFREIARRANDPKMIKKGRRCETWKDNCFDLSRMQKTVTWLQLRDELCMPFINEELENGFGSRFVMDEIDVPDSLDGTRKERSSILSDSRSKTTQQTSVINATTDEVSLDRPQVPLLTKTVQGNISIGDVETLQKENIPELPLINEDILPEEIQTDAVVVEETEQTNLGQSQILPDVPCHEPMPIEIQNADIVPVENLNVTNARPASEREQPTSSQLNARPANERQQPTSSQLSQESMSSRCSQDSASVFATIQKMCGDFYDYILFTELCPIGATSKKKAATVFYILLELHKMRKVRLHQVSPDVIRIYKR